MSISWLYRKKRGKGERRAGFTVHACWKILQLKRQAVIFIISSMVRLPQRKAYLRETNFEIQFFSDWHVLYSFFAIFLQDSKGSRPVPLPGFEVSPAPSAAAEKTEVKHIIRLSNTQQTLLLSAQDEELQAKWVDFLSKAARGEASAEASTSLTEHRKSQ